jgi:hypothetical protein
MAPFSGRMTGGMGIMGFVIRLTIRDVGKSE